ncbi:L-ribulose-5-phosphate 4-epimerase [[Mycoplasma] cavipharyngis]|uniref:L-ribulose-5-phosphate 4-epimerase n=1 Tax=[Mycoplasma] cavipharyngis TaxID=92757 RepID=UPI003704B895
MLENLKKQVYETNMALVKHGLVVLTWGNASAYDDATGYVVIKPSGVSYDVMTPEDMVVVDLDGKIIEGTLNPSSDTPTHLALYRKWNQKIKAIIHTHSTNATAFAQAMKPIPCLGTTHADVFYGSVLVTRILTENEIANNYELNTAIVILETFANIDPLAIPAILVANHGPFCWGSNLKQALNTAVTLEAVAEMSWKTTLINPDIKPISQYIQDKHYFRKHGPNAYYGQKKQ